MRALKRSIKTGLRKRARAARREDGWALVISLIVMTVMLGFGMAIVSIADTQSKLSGTGRQRDAALSLADAALNAELFAVANNWPGRGDPQNGNSNPFPVCTPSQTDTRCPSATMLRNLISDPDTASNVTWQINVYDNDATAGLQSFYSDSYTSGGKAYDANGDGKLWVRAQATVGSVTKTVVTLAQAQKTITPLPRAVILAGSVQTTNNGNKVIIDTQGSSQPPPGAVYVRCTPTTPSLTNTCLQYDPTKGQVSPDTAANQPSWTGGSSLTPSLQTQLKAEAVANGTYYATCPPNAPSGAIVWIDSGNCSWTGNATLNSAAQPGLLVINNGTVSFGGTLVFYGLVYGLNGPNPNTVQTVVSTGGNAQIIGAVFVDGNGGVGAGSSKLNVTFDVNALSTVSTIAGVGYIQSTWREL